jgi:hypothetical protein
MFIGGKRRTALRGRGFEVKASDSVRFRRSAFTSFSKPPPDVYPPLRSCASFFVLIASDRSKVRRRFSATRM